MRRSIRKTLHFGDGLPDVAKVYVFSTKPRRIRFFRVTAILCAINNRQRTFYFYISKFKFLNLHSTSNCILFML